MTSLRRIAILLILVCLCSVGASASELLSEQAESFGTDTLWEPLTKQTKELLEGVDPTSESDLSQGLFSILRNAAEEAVGGLRGGLALILRLIFTVVLCKLVDSLCEARGRSAVLIAGALTLMTVYLGALQKLIGVGESTMGQMSDFLLALNPVLASAAAASGSLSGAGANYALTVFFSNILLQLSMKLIVPQLYAYLALALTDSLLGQESLKRLRELLGWLVEILLKTVVYAFTGCLTVMGVLSGAADAAKLKAAKVTISSMIPVVGGIVSGAAESVLNGAALLKGTIGTFGMLAILAIFLLPFLRLTIHWLLLKLACALSGVMSSGLTGLLEAISKSMGYLLAMLGSSAVICLLSCCCYLKVVQF